MPDRTPTPFFRLWITEAVRLREAHWGLVDDQDAVRLAKKNGGDFAERLQVRAEAIGQRDALTERLVLWQTGGKWTLIVLLLVALLTGGLTASGALGDPARPVNILWALGALLGVHAVTFLVWLVSLLWGGGDHNLGGIWLWMTRKLARGPQSRLVPSAFVNLLTQAHAKALFFGTITHLLWFMALASAVITLVALLSTAQYQFLWATTLLDPETFVAITRTLGAVPSLLGFPSPAVATILASDGRSILPATANAQWSLWLLGVMLVFGVLPRLIAFGVCVVRLRRAMRQLGLDTQLAGYANLRDRLLPPVEPPPDHLPDPSVHQPHIDASRLPANTTGRRLVASLELPPAFSWPPPLVANDASLTDAGPLDTREQRHRLLDALASGPAERLLVVCDRRQTPDRGTIGLIADLARHTNALHVWLADTSATAQAKNAPPVISSNADATDRSALWREQLNQAGLGDDSIAVSEAFAVQWLQESAT